MQVVRAHEHRRRVSIAVARRAISEAAERIADGVAGPETQALVAKLEKMTGCSIGDLATTAKKWPADID
jgi:hypothetical protein